MGREVPGQTDDGKDSEGEDIGSWGRRDPVAADKGLRGGVGWCRGRKSFIVRIEEPRGAKIDEFDLVLMVETNIFRFQIQMRNAVLMQCSHGRN